MRKLILIGGSLLSVLIAGGCATPAYSAAERSKMIQRNFDYNGRRRSMIGTTFFCFAPPVI